MPYTEDQIRRAIKDFGRSAQIGTVDRWLAHYRGMAGEAMTYAESLPAINRQIVGRAREALDEFDRTGIVGREDADHYIVTILNVYADSRMGR